MVHELSKARQFQKHNCQRAGRLWAWMDAQKRTIPNLNKADEKSEDGPFSPAIIFRPICSEQPQIVLFRVDSSGIISFHLGVVFSVFRGAVSTVKGAPRKLKVSKAMGHNTPAEAVARLLVLELKPLGLNEDDQTQELCTTVMSKARLIVPSRDVVCEAPCVRSGERSGVAFFGLHVSTFKSFQDIEAGKVDVAEIFDSKKPEAHQGADSVPDKAVGFTAGDFPRGVSGRKAILQFMQKLPQAYQLQGTKILDSNDCYKISGHMHTWESLASRASLFFEMVTDKGDSKISALSFSSAVYHRLAGLFGFC